MRYKGMALRTKSQNQVSLEGRVATYLASTIGYHLYVPEVIAPEQ